MIDRKCLAVGLGVVGVAAGLAPRTAAQPPDREPAQPPAQSFAQSSSSSAAQQSGAAPTLDGIPPSAEAMFGKSGETPGFYAFPDCTAPGLVVDGLKADTGEGYEIWLHQRSGNGAWVGLFTVGQMFTLKPDGVNFEFSALNEFFKGKAVDVVDGVPGRIAEAEVRMSPMPAGKRLQSRGKDIELVRCAGPASSVLGATWRKLGF